MPETRQSEPGDQIISQYLSAQLISKQQALIIAQNQTPELFTQVSQDFLRFSQLLSRWYSRPATQPINQRHQATQLQHTLEMHHFKLVRRQRLPSLQGNEDQQAGLLSEVLALAQIGPTPEVLFRKRGEQLQISLTKLQLPPAYLDVFARSQPLSYVLQNMSQATLEAFVLRRDLEICGITPYINRRHPQRLQLRFVCLEQLHLPF